MNIANANHIIKTLHHVIDDKHNFDMWNWIDRNSCGTVACALGWETLTEYAHKQGLSFSLEPMYIDADGTRHFGFHAGARYLDVNEATSVAIFYSRSYTPEFRYIAPQQVIERIRYFIEGGRVPNNYKDMFIEDALLTYQRLPGGYVPMIKETKVASRVEELELA